MARRKVLNSNPEAVKDVLKSGRLSLADACRAIRLLQGVSQDEFALRIGVNRKVVKDLERGRGNATRESLERIARAGSLRVAFIPEQSAIPILDSRKRLADEAARRLGDARELREGTSAQELYRRNAMSLGGLKLRLPRIA